MFVSEVKKEWMDENRSLFEGSHWVKGYQSAIEADGWNPLNGKDSQESFRYRVAWHYGEVAGILVYAENHPFLSIQNREVDKAYRALRTQTRMVYVAYTRLEAIRYLFLAFNRPFIVDLQPEKKQDYRSIPLIQKRFDQAEEWCSSKDCQWVRLRPKFNDIRSKIVLSLRQGRGSDLIENIRSFNIQLHEVEEDSSSWTPAMIRQHLTLINRMYYRLLKHRMEMTGEAWNLRVSYSRKVMASDVDALKQKWADRGYQEADVYQFGQTKVGERLISFDLNHRPRKNQRLVTVKYVDWMTLDHKYNDGRIAYYRHVLKRHIYDYYRATKEVTQVEVMGKHGEVIWNCYPDMTVEEESFISKLVRKKLLYKARRVEEREMIKAWIAEDLTIDSKDPDGTSREQSWGRNAYDDSMSRWVSSSLYKLSYEMGIELTRQLYEARYQSLIREMSQAPRGRVRDIVGILHDQSLPYDRFIQRGLGQYCTQSVKQRILQLTPQQFERLVEVLEVLSEYKELTLKDVRQTLYQ